MLCPCFTKRTLNPGKSGMGRVYGPPISTDFLDGGKFNNTAIAAYDSMRFFMTRTFASQGVTFSPVVWSRSTNVMNHLKSVELVPSPRTVYRHRFEAPNGRARVGWPLVFN
jgi:hypothetical protein